MIINVYDDGDDDDKGVSAGVEAEADEQNESEVKYLDNNYSDNDITSITITLKKSTMKIKQKYYTLSAPTRSNTESGRT